MQIDIGGIIVTAIISTAVGISLGYLLRESGGKISAVFKSELEVVIKDALHINEGGLFVHYVGVDISNNIERKIKITNMRFRDKKNNNLKLVRRGQKSPYTEFEINGNETVNWSCFFNRKSTKDIEQAKIKLGIDTRLGKRTKWINFNSVMCEPNEFPSGVIFAAFLMHQSITVKKEMVAGKMGKSYIRWSGSSILAL